MYNLQDVVQFDLKKMDLLPEEQSAIRSFDVSDKVMKRVYQKAGRQSKARFGIRLRPGYAMLMMTLVIVLSLSVTAYAGSQYLEFRNQHGDAVMNTGKAGASSEEYTRLIAMYAGQVKQQLQPGEFAAYYVKDDFVASKDIANPVKFIYKEQRLTSLGSLQNEITRTQAPALASVSDLPKGYRFDYGFVYPVNPFSRLMENPEYRALSEALILESESAAAEDKVFYKKLSWAKADFTLARYTNGANELTITARATDPETKLTTVVQNDSDTSEKLSINNIEAYYMVLGDTSRESFKEAHRLGWIDPERLLYYEIYDNTDSTLTKEDFVKLAQDILKTQK